MNNPEKNNNSILNSLYFQLVAVNILINMIQPFNQLIDTILTGKALGAQALEVYALFLPVNSFLLAVSCFLSKGSQITVSWLIGKGNFEESDQAISTSVVMGVFISLVFSIICFSFSRKFAFLLGAAELTDIVSAYIKTISIGIMPAILLDIFMCLLQLEGKELVVTIGSTCVLLVNAAGDIANIFIFKKGVVGMAAATSAANIIACIFLGTVFFRKSKLFHFSLQRIRKHLSARIMKNGLPSLAYYGSLVIRNAFMNMLIITTLGRDVLVSMLVFTSFGTIADVLIGGHSDSVLVLGGVLYGEKDKKSAASLLRISIISGSILMLIVTVMTTIFSVPMAKLFLNQNDIAFAPEAGSALFLASFYLIPDIISCIEKKYIQSIGNGMYTAVTNVLYNVICVCIIAFILTKIIGTDGLFLSFTGCYLIAAIVNSIYIVFFSFKRFDVPGACTESFSITNLDECIEASEKVRNYSRLKGIDSRRSLLLGLFVEEIGKNIINYGFKKHHNSSIIVKLSITNDSVTLNIKDNCVLFDPTKFYDTMRNDESAREKSIGIRMLMELSGKVTYTTSFNLNNLLIEV